MAELITVKDPDGNVFRVSAEWPTRFPEDKLVILDDTSTDDAVTIDTNPAVATRWDPPAQSHYSNN